MAALALTWFGHRRTTELCAGLGIELLVLDTSRRGVLRYVELFSRTVRELARRRPQALLVQNPSLVLAMCAVLLRPFFRYRLLVDAHNEAVEPVVNPQWWIRWVSHWVLRRSDVTIVTNRQLAAVVTRVGGRPFVLPDRVPTPPDGSQSVASSNFKLVLICTFAADEPVGEVFEAVRNLEVELHVTGNHRKLAPALRESMPKNVVLTGFLSEEAYWDLLRAADAVIDLTTMDNCLVCGGYEAIALEKPLLLSGNEASRDLFQDGATYTDNTSADIRRAVDRIMRERPTLAASASQARERMTRTWKSQALLLAQQLAG
jgi:hypothetical protein